MRRHRIKTVSRFLTRKEQGKLRCYILGKKLLPDVLGDNEGLVWSEGSAVVQGATREVCLLDGALGKQMGKMMAEGCFGVELTCVPTDVGRYWNIRDDLYTYPDTDRVKSRGLFNFNS